jgi:hypothetical protein
MGNREVQLPLGEVALYTIIFVALLITLYKFCFAQKSGEEDIRSGRAGSKVPSAADETEITSSRHSTDHF